LSIGAGATAVEHGGILEAMSLAVVAPPGTAAATDPRASPATAPTVRTRTAVTAAATLRTRHMVA